MKDNNPIVAPDVLNLKCDPNSFQEVKSGKKTAELRLEEDKLFKVGQIIYLQEYDRETRQFSGDELVIKVTHILRDREFPQALKQGWCLLSFKLIRKELVSNEYQGMEFGLIDYEVRDGEHEYDNSVVFAYPKGTGLDVSKLGFAAAMQLLGKNGKPYDYSGNWIEFYGTYRMVKYKGSNSLAVEDVQGSPLVLSEKDIEWYKSQVSG